MEDFTDRFNRVLAELKAQGITATAVAEALGITKSAISKAKTGFTNSLTGENLLALEDKFGYSARWLVTGTGPARVSQVREALARSTLIDAKLQSGELLDLSDLPAEARDVLRATYEVLKKSRPL